MAAAVAGDNQMADTQVAAVGSLIVAAVGNLMVAVVGNLMVAVVDSLMVVVGQDRCQTVAVVVAAEGCLDLDNHLVVEGSRLVGELGIRHLSLVDIPLKAAGMVAADMVPGLLLALGLRQYQGMAAEPR